MHRLLILKTYRTTIEGQIMNKLLKLALSVTLVSVLAACDGDDGQDGAAGPAGPQGDAGPTGPQGDQGPAAVTTAGAVFVMTNEINDTDDGNAIAAFLRGEDGSLTFNGSFPTGGNGSTDFDGGEGLDPLISAYSLINTPDNRFILAVNAGSNTISSFRINTDFTLTLIDVESTDAANTGAIGPNSLAYFDGVVYVTNIDADGDLGEPIQEGNVTGFELTDTGQLFPIPNSTRELNNRPSAVRFAPNGDYLLISSINAGSNQLESLNEDALVVYGVDGDGVLSSEQTDGVTSTLQNNAEGRNLPSAIGFEMVARGNDIFAVVTEAREFQVDGAPPVFPELQTGSVSVWQLMPGGTLDPIQLDVPASSPEDNQRTACWIAVSPDSQNFWVSNALDASITSFQFSGEANEGEIEMVGDLTFGPNTPTSDFGLDLSTTPPTGAFRESDGFIDLDITDDGQFIYQLFGLTGSIGIYQVNGSELTEVGIYTGNLIYFINPK
jgi:6-phosphogluconolactonase (cycloisomerase 2 family)